MLTIALLLAAAFVVILNETILNVALPHLIDSLDVSPSTVQWVTTGFMLTMAVVIPTTGWILSRLTTRQAYSLAMGSFLTGTVIAALAPGFGALLAARVVQGFGTAIMIPLLMTTILNLVPVSRRGAVMGNVTIVIAVAPALGPTISGLILANFSWRFLFIFVIPVVVIVMTGGLLRLRNVSEPGEEKLDITSVILSVPGFAGLVYGLSQLGESTAGASRAVAVGALIAGAALVAVFVWRQVALQRTTGPMLDMRTFRFGVFRTSIVLLSLSMVALFGVIIILPIYMQTVRGLDSIVTGLVLLPGGLAMGLMGPVVGRVFDRIGARPLTVTGTIIMAVVMFAFTFVGLTTPVWFLITGHILFSLGMSLIFTPVFTASLNPLPPRLYSHGSAILTTLQQVAAAAGTALLIAIMQVTALRVTGPDIDGPGLLPGIEAAFWVALGLALLAIVAGLLMPGRSASQNHSETVAKEETATR